MQVDFYVSKFVPNITFLTLKMPTTDKTQSAYHTLLENRTLSQPPPVGASQLLVLVPTQADILC